MTQSQARHELKYLISPIDAAALRHRLRAALRPDAHAGPGGYRIRSLYFDNPDNKALREKLDGVSVREKFRIRYYNADPSFIRLEKKCKAHGLCRKAATPVTRAGCERLLQGDTLWLRDAEDPLLMELYCKMTSQGLRPKVIVDYDREAFVFGPGNVRVTLDSHVRTALQATALFRPDLSMAKAQAHALVLEVKYDAYLPDLVRDLIQTNTRQASAFSKYAVCRIYG